MSEILEEHIIDLPLGKVKGGKKLTIYDDPYYSFEGIPYGKPPLGELRFRAPEPADPWTPAVIDCTKDFQVKPVQKNKVSGAIEGTEDCLYMNVYAKTLTSEKPLPVMVYIFGGGFYTGEATRGKYSPDYFMAEDVILITFNYRVCSLGFLRLADPALKVPGNAGLKDQVLALKWVKQYIKYFNGDPDNITVWGHSAGGCATHYMMITEQTRGLFHKAIPMSGFVLNNSRYTTNDDLAYRLAKFHGYDGERIDADVLKFLMSLQPDKLVQHDLLTADDHRKDLLFPFFPNIELYEGEDCVIPRHPVKMLKQAWTNAIPIMIGGTSYEGLLMNAEVKKGPLSIQNLMDNPECILPAEVTEAHSEAENKELTKKIIKLHFGDAQPDESCVHQLLDFYSYKWFLSGMHRTVLARQLYAPTAHTYFYRFDFDSADFNLYRNRICDKGMRGVAHADDLSYLFYSKYAWKLDTNSEEYKTIRRMVCMRTAFAKTSNPNCEELKAVTWEPLQPGDPWTVLNISNDLSIIEIPERHKLEQWHSLYKKEELC